jgi:sulfur-carrier protein
VAIASLFFSRASFMSNSSITITVKLFAVYQEAYKVPELRLEFPEGTPVQTVQEYLQTQHPELAKWRNVTRFGINLLFVEPDTMLKNGDEVVLIPPVSGG